MIVLDASIIIKWFINESDSEIALQFKEDLLQQNENIVVPDLALYEIVNVLRFKNGVNERAIKAILPALFNLGIEIITPSQELLEESLHLSFATDLSIYDCVYLALANELGVNQELLFSADLKMVSYFGSRFDNRIRYAQKALEIHPDHPRALRYLAWTYWLMGAQDRALETYRKLGEVDPRALQEVFELAPDIKKAFTSAHL